MNRRSTTLEMQWRKNCLSPLTRGNLTGVKQSRQGYMEANPSWRFGEREASRRNPAASSKD
jgi:hypothetical protein